MADTQARSGDDAGKLVLRLALGILLLLHGIAKISGGTGGIARMLEGMGMPAALSYGVYVGEVLAPLLIILGLWTRLGALLVVVNMVFALALAHRGDFLLLTKTGGWALELQAFYLFTALALMLIGAGRYSMGGVNGRWN